MSGSSNNNDNSSNRPLTPRPTASLSSSSTALEMQRSPEYHIERARHLFGLALMHCMRCGVTPKLTQGTEGEENRVVNFLFFCSR
jgi:hypothetical protein